MSADRPTLRGLHRHVCEDGTDGPLLCAADEDDPREAGVCAAWDAIREARDLGRAEALAEAEVAIEGDVANMDQACKMHAARIVRAIPKRAP